MKDLAKVKTMEEYKMVAQRVARLNVERWIDFPLWTAGSVYALKRGAGKENWKPGNSRASNWASLIVGHG